MTKDERLAWLTAELSALDAVITAWCADDVTDPPIEFICETVQPTIQRLIEAAGDVE